VSIPTTASGHVVNNWLRRPLSTVRRSSMARVPITSRGVQRRARRNGQANARHLQDRQAARSPLPCALRRVSRRSRRRYGRIGTPTRFRERVPREPGEAPADDGRYGRAASSFKTSVTTPTRIRRSWQKGDHTSRVISPSSASVASAQQRPEPTRQPVASRSSLTVRRPSVPMRSTCSEMARQSPVNCQA
jgi:hypothetical protein